MSNWGYIPPYNLGQSGSVNVNGGGGTPLYLQGFRNGMDAMRSAAGYTPDAQYPDGYLGTIIDRRQDKLFDALKGKLTNRSYQRGVHKGERIDPADYYWPEEFNPQTGLEYEARGLKWTARGGIEERLAHMGKTDWATPQELGNIYAKYGVTDASVRNVAPLDPVRADQLRRYQPTWR